MTTTDPSSDIIRTLNAELTHLRALVRRLVAAGDGMTTLCEDMYGRALADNEILEVVSAWQQVRAEAAGAVGK